MKTLEQPILRKLNNYFGKFIDERVEVHIQDLIIFLVVFFQREHEIERLKQYLEQEERKNIIAKNYAYLVDFLQPKNGILDKLVSNLVITQNQKADIQVCLSYVFFFKPVIPLSHRCHISMISSIIHARLNVNDNLTKSQ